MHRLLLVLCTVVFVTAPFAAPSLALDASRKCEIKKLSATGRGVAAILNCKSGDVRTGPTENGVKKDATCVAKAVQKLSDIFAKVETRASCAGSAATVQPAIDGFIDRVRQLVHGSCGAGLVCDTSHSGFATCRNVGGGQEGQGCGQIADAACDAGLVCDVSTDFARCRKVGTGTQNQGCGKPSDASCAVGLVCDSSGSDFNRCRFVGTGTQNQGCGNPFDTPCDTGLVCDASTDFDRCRIVGTTGTQNQGCGKSIDAPCAVGLVCDADTSGFHTCRLVGTGGEGAGCGTFFDAPAP